MVETWNQRLGGVDSAERASIGTEHVGTDPRNFLFLDNHKPGLDQMGSLGNSAGVERRIK